MSRGLTGVGAALLLIFLFITPKLTIAAPNTDGNLTDLDPAVYDDINLSKNYFIKAVKVRLIRLCNDDGSDPGNLSMSQFQNGINEANEVLQNSGANMEYVIDPETDLNTCVQDSLANYECFLNPDLFSGKDQLDITDAEIEALTECDLNGDETCDNEDKNFLCDRGPQGIRRKNLAYDHIGSLVVFVRGKQRARRLVAWDEAAGHWIAKYPTGGYSACAGFYVVMNSGWWGNLFAHESGHYLCSPHTFGRRAKNADHALEVIEAVIDKYGVDYTDPTAVLNATYDGDRFSIDILGDHVVTDTPPDPGKGLWATHFENNGGACDPDNETIEVTTTKYDQPVTYVLQPDRSLVMSYFKGCTGLGQRFTPHQLERHELALKNHRQHLVDKDVRDCYYAKHGYVTQQGDWEGIHSHMDFNRKQHFLDQCQFPPDPSEMGRLADKKLYPIEIPIPRIDPFVREDLAEEEIMEEIELDLMEAPQLNETLTINRWEQFLNPAIHQSYPSQEESLSPTQIHTQPIDILNKMQWLFRK